MRKIMLNHLFFLRRQSFKYQIPFCESAVSLHWYKLYSISVADRATWKCRSSSLNLSDFSPVMEPSLSSCPWSFSWSLLIFGKQHKLVISTSLVVFIIIFIQDRPASIQVMCDSMVAVTLRRKSLPVTPRWRKVVRKSQWRRYSTICLICDEILRSHLKKTQFLISGTIRRQTGARHSHPYHRP